MYESSPPVSDVTLQQEVNAREMQWRDHISSIAAGDESALAVLYNASSRLVYSLIFRILTNATDAEEVTLDVYTQVWRNASKFESHRGTVMAWLVIMARSRAIDRLRSQRNFSLTVGLENDSGGYAVCEDTPESQTVGKESVKYVRRALEDLPREQREAILLSFFSGLSHPEVAERLSIPLGTVKTRIRLGMLKLKDSLIGLRMEARRAIG